MPRPQRAARYRAVLTLPHALPLFAAASGARLCYGTMPLAILLGVQQATDSYTNAGLAEGGLGLGAVLLGPMRGRLVDRYGPRRSLGPMAGAFAALLVVLAAAVTRPGTPLPVLLACCAAIGCTAPPLGPTMRSCWRLLAPEAAALQRAFSLDSVVEETLYMVGPLLTGLAIALATPAAAIAMTALLAAAGTAGMLASPVIARWRPEPATHGEPTSLRRRGFVPLLIMTLAIGIGVSAVELGAAGYAQRAHHPGAAGLLAAVMSAASALGGLGYGAVGWRRSLGRRLTLLAAGQAIAALALSAWSSVPATPGPQYPALWVLARTAGRPRRVCGAGDHHRVSPGRPARSGRCQYHVGHLAQHRA